MIKIIKIKEVKENTNKILNGFQENINEQLNEIKTKQNVKLGFNKDTEILKIKLKWKFQYHKPLPAEWTKGRTKYQGLIAKWRNENIQLRQT